jgi:hypothetical protein
MSTDLLQERLMHHEVIRRVLDLEEIKSHHCRGQLKFPFDVDWTIIPEFLNPLQVRDSSGKHLGFACLEVRDYGHLHVGPPHYFTDVEAFLTRQAPERLDLEQGLRVYSFIADNCVRIEERSDDQVRLRGVKILSLKLIADPVMNQRSPFAVGAL